MSIVHTPQHPFIESSENDTYIGFIDGEQCTTMDLFYDAIIRAMQLPDYFGRNLDALDEVLSDLSWIDYGVKFLIIQNSDELLKDEKEMFGELLATLMEVGNDDFEVVMS
jgi:RNAse (barnase) inhibitor barstar